MKILNLKKVMLTALFDAEGISHDGFAPEKQNTNCKLYKDAIMRSIARVIRVRPEFQGSESPVSSAPQDTGPLSPSSHAPYPTNLAPADLFLVSYIKKSQ
jgi:hypothetical protein